MQLDILRHAKSDWGDERQGDHERPLSPRGIRAAAAVGTYLRGRGDLPELVLCSSALRTRQTWAGIADALGDGAKAVDLVVEKKLYLASARLWQQRIAAADHKISRLMVVGHNPGVAELAQHLAGSGDSGLRRLMASKYPTAALTTLCWEGSAAKLIPGIGRLVSFLTPKDLV